MNARNYNLLTGARLPRRLQQLPEPPRELFLHGELGRPPYAALVGTRNPSEGALRFTRELAAHLAEKGVTVLSGGAVGIDRAAHEGAMDAQGQTVVVAPSSFDSPFPAEHRELFGRIVARGGGYISAYRSNVTARRHHFFLRNSLMAALCDIMVMVEAPYRSGARNALAWARRLQRPCYIAPAAPWNGRGTGCIAELRLGGMPFGTARDLLQALVEQGLYATALPSTSRSTSTSTLLPALPSPRKGDGDDDARNASQSIEDFDEQVFQIIATQACTPDEIAVATRRSAAEVSHVLLLLQLSGRVGQDVGGRFTSSRE